MSKNDSNKSENVCLFYTDRLKSTRLQRSFSPLDLLRENESVALLDRGVVVLNQLGALLKTMLLVAVSYTHLTLPTTPYV